MRSFKDLLGKELLFFDGATGTELQARGLQPGEVPDLWNFSHPDIVEAVHRAYFEGGVNIVKTNTFGANKIKLGDVISTAEVVKAAVGIAKKAAEGRERRFVALDIGPTGKLLAPYGDLPFEDAVEAFGEMARAGEKAGADLILIETMSDIYEVKAALLGCKENSSLPILVTLSFDEDGKLLTGGTVTAAAAMCEALGAAAVGFNCGLGPQQVQKLLPEMLAGCTLPIITNPNAGMPVERDGKTVYEIGPEEYADLMYKMIRQGVSLAGGCCGTTPGHIASMIDKCKGLPAGGRRYSGRTLITSYGKAVELGNDPVIIGERINPTGKKLLKEALARTDMDYVCRLGLEQVEAGAHILDVNVGAPKLDEEALLAKAVVSLQAVTDAPLQLDTAKPGAMAKALRCYNGKPLLNSVNAKEESLAEVLPLAKKYGAVVVGLCLDENGIPDTAEGRLKLAEKILARAAAVGIPKRDVIIDPLTLTISTDAHNAELACQVVRALTAQGVRTVMGVSNISFGLPARETVNAAFFGMALHAGLSAGIINPMSRPMLDAYYAYRALAGFDVGCKDYVVRYADNGQQQASAPVELTLEVAIAKGLLEASRSAARQCLTAGEAPLDIINGRMIPALDLVGRGFEEKKLFLPQLLMSADAAKAAFEEIRKAVGTGTEQGETVVLATVHGDIHDIGKNIVKVLMENYGYRVLDLGKDVPVATVVQQVKANGAKAVGLSALMTTTVGAMEETIRALRQETDCRIIVGGAVLTEDYAQSIGADYYAPNAVAAVNGLNAIFGK